MHWPPWCERPLWVNRRHSRGASLCRLSAMNGLQELIVRLRRYPNITYCVLKLAAFRSFRLRRCETTSSWHGETQQA